MLKPSRSLLVLASLLFALAGAPRLHAMGSPPLMTDDTGTAPVGHWEFNIGLISTERRPGSRLTEGPILDVNYGLSDRMHLNYELPYRQLSEDGSPSQRGLGNSTLGVKWRFFDGGEKGLSVSVFPKVEFNNPGSSAADRGLVEHGRQYQLPLQFQRIVGSLTLVGKIGREFGAGGDSWAYGMSPATMSRTRWRSGWNWRAGPRLVFTTRSWPRISVSRWMSATAAP